ncbi:MAG TPA: translation elongation factor 4 [Chloroflexota bacterium]
MPPGAAWTKFGARLDQAHIRNFCIVAHIDHGKSTLADRLLELTQTIRPRDMAEQVLDVMDLERERGITIKLKPVRMLYTASDGYRYQLNLIDTPGHVDFTYEVSRSLAACEGAILVVDAAQGIEAQTLANVYLALEHDLALIPVVNKIDLPAADPDGVAKEIEKIIGLPRDKIFFISAKEGTGVPALLEAIVREIPPPKSAGREELRALVFDSHYDSYKGVIAHVRVMDGSLRTNDPLLLMAEGSRAEALEVGIFRPGMESLAQLDAGEVGYVATALKEASQVRVGDTITSSRAPAQEPLPGYRPAKPMVFAGLYPIASENYPDLRAALEKLRLNDASLSYEPENSIALGPGYRCGFLGMLHMDIVRERLEREYDLDLLITAPSVGYRVLTTAGEELVVDNPAELPEPQRIATLFEPWMRLDIVSPSRFIGTIMEMVRQRRGFHRKMEYLDELHVLLEFEMPLADLIVDFYDQLKSSTQGYASLDYQFEDERPANLVKLDVLVNGEPVDALSTIIPADQAQSYGRGLVEKLRKLIPRQMFDVPIQAAIGPHVVARETVRALRKNVLAKCYGGDITRKRKLLEKQAEGKKRMKRLGHVDVPQEAFMALLARNP